MSEQHGTQGNPFPGEPNTGHIWDGNLRELSSPPPNWWLWGFYASGLWVLIYFILFPSIPLVSSHTKGILGWTAMGEYHASQKVIEQVRLPYEKKIAELSPADILKDKDLSAYAQTAGKVLFGDNCAACHGPSGSGNPGFPVLADDDWLYGGTIDKIYESISGGRGAVMPSFGKQLPAKDIERLAQYVTEMEKGAQASDPEGQKLFMSQPCFACHGPDGKGNQMMGSKNLTDGVWRFMPGGKESAIRTITHGVNSPDDPETRNAQMPVWSKRLTTSEIKELAVYVHELGGGQ